MCYFHQKQDSLNSFSSHLNQVSLTFSFNFSCFGHNHNETTTAVVISLRQCLFCLMRQKQCWSYFVFSEHDWLKWSQDKVRTHYLLIWWWQYVTAQSNGQVLSVL